MRIQPAPVPRMQPFAKAPRPSLPDPHSPFPALFEKTGQSGAAERGFPESVPLPACSALPGVALPAGFSGCVILIGKCEIHESIPVTFTGNPVALQIHTVTLIHIVGNSSVQSFSRSPGTKVPVRYPIRLPSRRTPVPRPYRSFPAGLPPSRKRNPIEKPVYPPCSQPLEKLTRPLLAAAPPPATGHTDRTVSPDVTGHPTPPGHLRKPRKIPGDPVSSGRFRISVTGRKIPGPSGDGPG